MRRVSLKQWGGWIALFALYVQLALSFGHMHADDVYGQLGHGVEQGQGHDSLAAQHRGSPETPVQQDTSDTADECGICAAVHLTATAVLPEPARVVPAIQSGTAGTVRAAPFTLAAAPYLLSRPRAPPSV